MSGFGMWPGWLINACVFSPSKIRSYAGKFNLINAVLITSRFSFRLKKTTRNVEYGFWKRLMWCVRVKNVRNTGPGRMSSKRSGNRLSTPYGQLSNFYLARSGKKRIFWTFSNFFWYNLSLIFGKSGKRENVFSIFQKKKIIFVSYEKFRESSSF